MELKAGVMITVPFHDVDIMHIAWHGHYLKYFELARTRLMQDYGLDWPRLRQEGISMPVVEVHIQYRKPLSYGSQVWVEASVSEYAYPELKVHYAIHDGPQGDLLSSGWTRQVYFSLEKQESLFEVPDFVEKSFERRN